VIQNETEVLIGRPVEEVFAFVDDEGKTPQWLGLCVSLARASDGPKGVGTKLHYVHREGGRAASMDGVVTAYEPGQRLGMNYTDRAFDVAVDFWLAAADGGTTLRHATAITPKTFVGRLMSPLIGGMTRRQMQKDLQMLKGLLEGG